METRRKGDSGRCLESIIGTSRWTTQVGLECERVDIRNEYVKESDLIGKG